MNRVRFSIFLAAFLCVSVGATADNAVNFAHDVARSTVSIVSSITATSRPEVRFLLNTREPSDLFPAARREPYGLFVTAQRTGGLASKRWKEQDRWACGLLIE